MQAFKQVTHVSLLIKSSSTRIRLDCIPIHACLDAGEGFRMNLNSFAGALAGGYKTIGGTPIHQDTRKAGSEVENVSIARAETLCYDEK